MLEEDKILLAGAVDYSIFGLPDYCQSRIVLYAAADESFFFPNVVLTPDSQVSELHGGEKALFYELTSFMEDLVIMPELYLFLWVGTYLNDPDSSLGFALLNNLDAFKCRSVYEGLFAYPEDRVHNWPTILDHNREVGIALVYLELAKYMALNREINPSMIRETVVHNLETFGQSDLGQYIYKTREALSTASKSIPEQPDQEQFENLIRLIRGV